MGAHLNRREQLSEALELVGRAIEILDDIGGPADVAAHLDFAYVRLEALLSASRTKGDLM